MIKNPLSAVHNLKILAFPLRILYCSHNEQFLAGSQVAINTAQYFLQAILTRDRKNNIRYITLKDYCDTIIEFGNDLRTGVTI